MWYWREYREDWYFQKELTSDFPLQTVKRSPDLMQLCSKFTLQPFRALLGPLTLCFHTVSFHPQHFVRQQATVSSLADEETGAQKVEVTRQRSRY